MCTIVCTLLKQKKTHDLDSGSFSKDISVCYNVYLSEDPVCRVEVGVLMSLKVVGCKESNHMVPNTFRQGSRLIPILVFFNFMVVASVVGLEN